MWQLDLCVLTPQVLKVTENLIVYYGSKYFFIIYASSCGAGNYMSFYSNSGSGELKPQKGLYLGVRTSETHQ